ncbi:histidine kinase [Parafilimonas sp.]|uniref:sensor histidine kinase n=1 Tax=Parafilimonas sp. TaxID=1969739 RepID=UPI0039E3E945
MRRIVAIFLVLFLYYTNALSQQYNYYHYDVKDGLSGNTVYAVAQDKDGFMWFGTETGLSRFDGSHFKNYTANDGLNDNEIIGLFIDSKNRVWIFPFRNSIYYYYEGKIYNRNNDSLLGKFNLKEEIFKACEDNEGNIIFLEATKLHILSGDNKLNEVDEINNTYLFNNSAGLSSDGYINIHTTLKGDRDHNVTICEYKKSKFFIKSTFQDSNYSRTAIEVNKYYQVIKNDFLFQIHNEKNNDYFELRVPDHFHTISYVNDSCFAISTFNKTLLYNINQKKVVDSFLINRVSNRCFSDSENNLWFVMSTQGVYRLSSVRFKIYKIKPNFDNTPVYSVCASNGILYMGTDENVLGELNLKNGALTSFYLKTNLNIKYVTEISIKNKDLFAATNVGVFQIKKHQTFLFLPSLTIKSILIDGKRVIASTDRGIFRAGAFKSKLSDTIWSSRATSFYKTGEAYYIGTLNSIYIVKDKNHDSVIDLGEKLPVLKNKIIKIIGAKNGDIWIATENNGLICLRDNKLIKQLTVKDGLLSNSCRCIYFSGNNIWIGTDSGINKIDLNNNSIASFTTADGLDCEIINCIYATGDSVFAGTPYGLTFFNAASSRKESVCHLKLLNIQSDAANWYANQDSIHLSSNDNFLRFEYAGISFVSAGDITYYYQVKGLSNEWQSTRQNILEFRLLYPGDYELNMYAVNKYGVKSSMLTVHFTKAKHYWQLLWVQIVFLAAIGALIWLLVRARIQAVKRKAREDLLRERRINELEQMALRAQMNPHFIFNSINSIQQYLFSGNVAEANEYITDFSSLVRQTLYMSGKKFITLTEEIKYLEAYLGLEQKKYEHWFTFRVIVEKDIDENILIPPLFIQPFVENSIRHGILNLQKGWGTVLVHFFDSGNALCCMVEDNGIGRSNALKKKANPLYASKGMQLVRDRIERLNSLYNVNITVAIEDIAEQSATGTRVIIKFPFSYAEQNN